MNATLLPAGESLVERIACRMEQANGDLSEVLVVFPGRRPAHFLRRRLAEGRRRGFLSPRLLSMDELVDFIFDGNTSLPRPKIEAIDAVAILYDIQLAASQPLGGAAFMTLDSFFSLGLKIHRDLEELAIEMVEPKRVAEVQTLVEEGVPPRSRERLQTLAHFYERFYPSVGERGLSTRSSRYREAAESISPDRLARFRLIILAGFYTLTASEKRIFEKIGARPGVDLFFQDGPGMREKMKALGVSAIPPEPAGSEPSRPTVSFYSSPDTHGQVFALGAALGGPDPDTLIVLPSPDTLFPLLRHCLSRFERSQFNVSLRYPLLRTPLFGFIESLMTLVGSMDGERVYLPDYISFFLHPYAKNVRFRGSAEATRVMFHTLEDRFAEKRTRQFMTLAEIEEDGELFAEAARRIGMESAPGARREEDRQLSAEAVAGELRAHLAGMHQRTIGAFRSFPDVHAFAEACIALVGWVNDESTARGHPLFADFAERFVLSLEEIARSLMASKSFTDTESYFTLLRNYVKSLYHPFPGTPLAGMQVLGALETRNLRFARVFVLDANEGVFPETGAENTLLPLPVRRALELSTSEDQEEMAAYHFALLAAGARELHLFSVESGEKERSRFAERLLWEREKEVGKLDERSLVKSIQYRVSLSNRPPEPVVKTGEVTAWLRLREYSATALDAYLKCPLKFYYQTVLGLGRREETSEEIEAADIGTFVHEALFRYFATRTGRPLAAEDADPRAMEAIVEELFSDRFGSAEAGANRLLLGQIRRHLSDFLTGYLRPLVRRERVTLNALEREIRASREGFALRGRLDAVEERAGRIYLLDYKTSPNAGSYSLKLKKLDREDRTTWSAAIPTLQLPFYILLYSAESRLPPEEIWAMFLLLGRTVLDEKIESPLFAEGAAAEGWPIVESVIFSLLREIASPEVPFSPALDPKSACPRCDFTGICGTAWLK